jgi:muramidase (phage lysozyme)
LILQRHVRTHLLAGFLSASAALPLAPLSVRAITASDVLPGADPIAVPAATIPQAAPQPLQKPAEVALLPPLRPATPAIYAITPERRALLNTIRFAEGTWADGHEVGYRIMFGGGLMPSLDRHPDRVVRSARYASAAAGAYQFMPFTWSMVTRALRLEGFGAEAQDQAALFLIQRRGALPMADQGTFTPELAARLAPEWASFPTLAGRSYYGQPVKRYEHLRRFYEDNLARLRSLELQNLAATPEPLPTLPQP